MKLTVNIDCTPQEARAFFGLPDVAPMQARMMEDVEARMRENLSRLDPEVFMKTWMPASVQNWQDIQKAFWGQIGAAAAGKE